MSETNHYSSQLTGQQIDEALMAARNIRNNSGVPVSSGTGLLSFRNLDTTLDGKSGGIPTSPAVMQAIKNTQSTFLNFRGSVPTVDDLPADPQKGDTYKVAADGHFYAWNGSGWDDIGTGAVAPTMASDIPTDDNRNVQEVLNQHQAELEQQQETLDQHQTALDGKAPIVNKNLLDNWYFANPVNQRGQTSYTNAGYTIDRWLMASGNISISNGAICTNIDIYEILPHELMLEGKTLTASIIADGTVYSGTVQFDTSTPADIKVYTAVSYAETGNSVQLLVLMLNNGNYQLSIQTQGSVVVEAVKLEEGDTQTLAHQENGVWVLNEIPDPAIELMKCLEYQYVLTGDYMSLGMCYTNSSTDLYLLLEVPNGMRTPSNPAISCTNAVICVANGGVYTANNPSFVAVGYTNGKIKIQVAGFNGLPVFCAGLVQFASTNNQLIVNCNL